MEKDPMMRSEKTLTLNKKKFAFKKYQETC